MARDPYNISFKCNRNSYKRTNQEVKKDPIFIVFASNFQVLGHVKNLLKLINALKMKNLFILTEQITKHMFVYTLPRGQHRN